MRTPKISNAIVCEDVRIENNGKHIIIGVYPVDILMPKFPANLRIVIWTQIDDVGSEDTNFEVRGRLDSFEFMNGGFTLSTSAPNRRATIPVGPLSFSVPKPSRLRVDLKYSNANRWKNLVTIPINAEQIGENI